MMTKEEKEKLELLEQREEGGDAGMTNAEWQELDRLRSILESERADAIVRPTCCEAATKYPAIHFSVDCYDEDSSTDEGRWSIAMNDYLSQQQRLRDRNWFEAIPSPKFCPYCATPLPKMVRKDPEPEGICKVTDGGYYCDTCRERLQGCRCLPLSAAFEPEK